MYTLYALKVPLLISVPLFELLQAAKLHTVNCHKQHNSFHRSQLLSVAKLNSISVGRTVNQAVLHLTWPTWCVVRVALVRVVAHF
jgi:hypothetical protein